MIITSKFVKLCLRPPAFQTSHTVLATCFLIFLTILCFSNNLDGKFVHDDISAIVHNNDVVGKDNKITDLFFHDFWGHPLSSPSSHKSHRPLTTLTFRWNASLDMSSTVGFHVVNIIMHIVVVILIQYLCLQILQWNCFKSSLAALLFAVHPVHTEAVSNIVGRADILATAFFLLSFISYARGQRNGRWKVFWFLNCVICATLSFMSKEQGISTFIFLIIYDLLCLHSKRSDEKSPENRKKSTGNSYLLFELCKSVKANMKPRTYILIFIAILVICLRIFVMGSQLPIFSQEDNPTSYASNFKTRLLTFNYLVAKNVELLLFPVVLSYDWQMGSVPLIHSFCDARNIMTVSLFTSIIAFFILLLTTKQVNERKTLCLGLILPILAFLPASNLMFYVGFVIAERILYMPSVGYIILITHGLYRLLDRLTSSQSFLFCMIRQLLYVFLSLFILSAIARTYNRNQVWLSRRNLFASGIRDLPHNAKMHYNYGNLLKDDGHIKAAESHYRVSIRLWPYYASAHNNLATVVNDSTEAIHHLQQAITFNPVHGTAYYNLAILHSKRNLTWSAIGLLEKAVAVDNGLLEAHSKLASLYCKVGRLSMSEAIHKRLVHSNPNNANLAHEYAIFLEHLGRANEAMKYYDITIKRNPSHVSATISKCRLLEAKGQLKSAKDIYSRYVKENSFNALVMDGLGSVLIKLHQYEDAATLYTKLLAVTKNFTRAKLHYAQILVERGQFVAAEDMLISIINNTSSDNDDSLESEQLALYTLSSICNKMNRSTEALEHVITAISLCQPETEKCAKLYVLHGDVMKQLNYLRQAAHSYKMALKLKPGLYHAHVNLGAIYHIQSEYDEAWQHYSAAKILQPSHPILLENMAKLQRAASSSSMYCSSLTGSGSVIPHDSINNCW